MTRETRPGDASRFHCRWHHCCWPHHRRFSCPLRRNRRPRRRSPSRQPLTKLIHSRKNLVRRHNTCSRAGDARGRLCPLLAIGETDGNFSLAAVITAGPDHLVAGGSRDDQARGIDRVDGSNVAVELGPLRRSGDGERLDTRSHIRGDEGQGRERKLDLVGVDRHGRIRARSQHDARLWVGGGVPAGPGGDDRSDDDRPDEEEERQKGEADEAALDLLVLLSEGAVLLGEGGKLLGRERAGALRVQIAKGPLFVRQEALVVGVPLLRYDGQGIGVLGSS